MKNILNKLYDHHQLSKQEAKEVLLNIATNAYNDAEIASFITVYLMRSIDVEELAGFREALLELCIPFDTLGMDTIDLCGTGGDGKNTFNISTVASFVVAGAGYKVVKHGNYGVSSISGSSNVLEYLGYNFTNKPDTLLQQLDQANICFCHAPLFHPALKGVGPIRKQLGVKSFFNMLGPLVNPAQPKHQLVGVFNLKLAQLYQYLYQSLDKSYAILYSLDGYDEISLTADTKYITNYGSFVLSPYDFNSPQLCPKQLYGGDSVEAAANLFVSILYNESDEAKKEVVLANAACAIRCFDPEKSLASCKEEARESLVSGAALRSLQTLLK